MTWEPNRHIVTQIKASITAGIRPCAMILHEQPTDPWLPFDFKLLEAYQMLQDEICPKCGHPVWLCRNESNRVEFKVRGATCYAEYALRAYENQKRDVKERATKKDREDWGRFYYTVPFSPENIEGDLPTRGEYYRSLLEG